MHFGIDYGSKLAGTTVITLDIDGILQQVVSAKKENADQMILDAVEKYRPDQVYIDAPLSLPKAYYGIGEDFFYRAADKALKAMSPMFLGGLTARAMKLKVQMEKMDIAVFETYPGAVVRAIPQLAEVYTKKDQKITPLLYSEILKLMADFEMATEPENLHQLDSVLAWYSGWRHLQGLAHQIGDPEEGVIVY